MVITWNATTLFGGERWVMFVVKIAFKVLLVKFSFMWSLMIVRPRGKHFWELKQVAIPLWWISSGLKGNFKECKVHGVQLSLVHPLSRSSSTSISSINLRKELSLTGWRRTSASVRKDWKKRYSATQRTGSWGGRWPPVVPVAFLPLPSPTRTWKGLREVWRQEEPPEGMSLIR